MLRKFEALALLGIVAVCFWALYQVAKELNKWDLRRQPVEVTQLKATEQEKFLVSENHVTTIKRSSDGKTEVNTEYVPKRAEIIVEKDGSVVVKNKRFGLALEPFLGMGYSDSTRFMFGAKTLYYDRLGLNAGLSMRLTGAVNPKVYLALSFDVISNTSVFLGIDNSKNILGGVSIKL